MLLLMMKIKIIKVDKGKLLLLLLLQLTTMVIKTCMLCKMCEIYGQAFTIPYCRNIMTHTCRKLGLVY